MNIYFQKGAVPKGEKCFMVMLELWPDMETDTIYVTAGNEVEAREIAKTTITSDSSVSYIEEMDND
jgi:hypothetical protein